MSAASLDAMRMVTGVALALFISSAWPSGAAAWGDAGHKIVCELAFQELNTHARQEVVRLIGLDQRFDTFSDSCVWPDDPRKRDAEHYVNVPRTFGRFSGTQCPTAFRCVLTAIRRDLEILRTAGSDTRRLESLKFLGHWVGDIHQPLHVSFRDDRRGGKIRGQGSCVGTLHAIWDDCLVPSGPPRDTARTLREAITDAERAAWPAVPVHEWANESLEIARRGSVRYCVRVGPACVYAVGNDRYDEGEPQRSVVVDAAYVDTHAPIVADRLKRAGVRLAHLLNTVFLSDTAPTGTFPLSRTAWLVDEVDGVAVPRGVQWGGVLSSLLPAECGRTAVTATSAPSKALRRHSGSRWMG